MNYVLTLIPFFLVLKRGFLIADSLLNSADFEDRSWRGVEIELATRLIGFINRWNQANWQLLICRVDLIRA